MNVTKINSRLDNLENKFKNGIEEIKSDFSSKLDKVNLNFNVMNKLLDSKLNYIPPNIR